MTGSGALVLHLLMALIALAWLAAAATLASELARALRGRPGKTGWSSRWATAVAGLLLVTVSTAAALAPTPGRRLGSVPSSVPAAASPVAASVLAGGTGRAQVSPHASSTATTTAPASSAAHRQPSAPVPSAVALVGLGFLGASALARRLGLLRRVGECLRRPGERVQTPDPETGWSEALIGPLGEADLLDWVEAANRMLWRSLREERRGEPGGPPLPEVELVRAGSGTVELTLARPVSPAADGFVSRDGGRRWILDPELDLDALEALTAGAGRFLAGLVPVGDDGEASFLVPLGAGRHLVLEGDESAKASVLAFWLVAMRTLPWAEELAVELVGCATPAAGEHCYQVASSSLAELAQLAADTPPPDRLLAVWSRCPVVVVGRQLAAREEELLDKVRRRAGLLSVGGVGSDRLILDERGALLEPLGVALVPPRPTAGQLRMVESLLEEASRAAEPLPDEPEWSSPAVDHPDINELGRTQREVSEPAARPTPPFEPRTPRAEPATTEKNRPEKAVAEPVRHQPISAVVVGSKVPARQRPGRHSSSDNSEAVERTAPGPIEVRLLAGAPMLEGLGTVPPSRDESRVTELVAYLALHDHQSELDELRSVVFGRPGAPGSARRAQNVGSLARRCLGRSGDGSAYLPAGTDGHYRLDDSVTCDWTRLRACSRLARRADPRQARSLLSEALALVEGRPGEVGRPGWPWFVAEGLSRRLVADVVDAAHHLALLCLAAGDPAGARWAVGQGRRAEPASDLLVRDLLAVCEADGDLEGMAVAYGELEGALDRLGGSEPSPETRALFHELSAETVVSNHPDDGLPSQVPPTLP
ncbi:MAG: rane protein [Acidimicrobiaceae bacterium]|nr:rane protein [Acidimicrobiaceae bacterium]